MDSSTAAIQPPITRDESGTLLGQTMGFVAVTTGFFAVGAYLGRDLAYGWGWAFFIAVFACLLGLNAAAQRSEQAGGATALFIAGFGAAGYATRRDLSALARVCLCALIAL